MDSDSEVCVQCGGSEESLCDHCGKCNHSCCSADEIECGVGECRGCGEYAKEWAWCDLCKHCNNCCHEDHEYFGQCVVDGCCGFVFDLCYKLKCNSCYVSYYPDIHSGCLGCRYTKEGDCFYTNECGGSHGLTKAC